MGNQLHYYELRNKNKKFQSIQEFSCNDSENDTEEKNYVDIATQTLLSTADSKMKQMADIDPSRPVLKPKTLSVGSQTPNTDSGGYSLTLAEDKKAIRKLGFNIEDRELGRGSYGIVFKGTYTPIATEVVDRNGVRLESVEVGKDFAAKYCKFDDNLQLSAEKREDLEKEKKILGLLNHRNIVKVLMIVNMGELREVEYKYNPNKYFLSPDRIFIIMDFAKYGDLSQYFEARHPFNEVICKNWCRMITEGLRYLHRKDIIHGDLKLQNVLIFEENGKKIPKLADFGISQKLTQSDIIPVGLKNLDLLMMSNIFEKMSKNCKLKSEKLTNNFITCLKYAYRSDGEDTLKEILNHQWLKCDAEN